MAFLLRTSRESVWASGMTGGSTVADPHGNACAVAYYLCSRTHLGLDKDSPTPRSVMPPAAERIVAVPEVNGLHHRYNRAAA